jgi:hypothetical protein
MVPSVGYQDLIFAVAGHVPRVIELAGLRTLLSKCQQEISGDRENL